MRKKILILVGILLITALLFSIWIYSHRASEISIRSVSYRSLPGFQESDLTTSFKTYQNSCRIFLKQAPMKPVGSYHIRMRAEDWHPSCKAALLYTNISKEEAKAFFEKWFQPVEFYEKKPITGLFTGYYLPLLHGSLTRTDQYNIPIYQTPSSLVTVDLSLFDPSFQNRKIVGRVKNQELIPFYTRAQINQGALDEKTPVIAWVNNHVDRLFLDIQGSGVIEMTDGSLLYVGYAGENGASYTPIGRVLIQLGVLKPENTSMQTIRAYLESHPNEMLKIINKNKSFVFFKILKEKGALGAQGGELTPGYSLAVDRKWIPLGTPIWLNTTRPSENNHDVVLRRLMIAQDTGGAIRGPVRGDVFWGFGDKATYIAGKMKNHGHYWLLLPREMVARLPKTFSN